MTGMAPTSIFVVADESEIRALRCHARGGGGRCGQRCYAGPGADAAAQGHAAALVQPGPWGWHPCPAELGREDEVEGQEDLLAPGLVRDVTPGGLVRPGPARDGVAIACR